jgi:hypothetical protein
LDDQTTDIILIDVDAWSGDILNLHLNELFGVVENPHTQTNTTQLELIVDDWIAAHNNNDKYYSFSVLSYSISGATPSENETLALDWMESQYVMVVQSAPNFGQQGYSWGELYSNVITVGAWNVDANNNALYSNLDTSFAVLDIFADGYIIHPDWGWAFGTSFATPKVAAELTNEFESIIADLNADLESGEITEQELLETKPLAYGDIVEIMQYRVTDEVVVDYKNSISSWPVNVLSDDVNQLLYPTIVPNIDDGNILKKVEEVYLITDFTNHEDGTQSRTYIDQNNMQWSAEYELSNTTYHEKLTNIDGVVITKQAVFYEDGSYIASKESTYSNSMNHVINKFWFWDSAQQIETITRTNAITQQVSVNQNKYNSIDNVMYSVDAISNINEGVVFNYDLSLRLTSDNLTETLSYGSTINQAGNLPDWLIIDTSTGILSGTPQADDQGNYEILMSVTDDTGFQVSDTFTLTVNAVLEVTVAYAVIQTDVNNYLDNISLDYFKDGLDTGVYTLVEGGGINFDQSLDFDSVKLSDPSAYDNTSSIQADDAVAILRDVVFLDVLDTNSNSWHAADVNNDGKIAADDAVAILKHIVFLDNIDTFDLVDNTTGNRVTNLNLDAALGEWTIVANGDVNNSGSFNDYYTVAVDII